MAACAKVFFVPDPGVTREKTMAEELASATRRPETVAAIVNPRAVDAGRGAAWWSEGWRLFTPAVGPWILIVVIGFVLNLILAFIPILGSIASQLAVPDPCGRPDARLPSDRSRRAFDHKPSFRGFRAEGRVAADRGSDLYRGGDCNHHFRGGCALCLFRCGDAVAALERTGFDFGRRSVGWTGTGCPGRGAAFFAFLSALGHGGMVRPGAGRAAEEPNPGPQ